jgi:hypothetical protein
MAEPGYSDSYFILSPQGLRRDPASRARLICNFFARRYSAGSCARETPRGREWCPDSYRKSGIQFFLMKINSRNIQAKMLTSGMTTLIIKSNSSKKTNLIMELAKELGLSVSAGEFEELNTNAMVTGIGRKATDEELIDYLSKDNGGEPIDIEVAFCVPIEPQSAEQIAMR